MNVMQFFSIWNPSLLPMVFSIKKYLRFFMYVITILSINNDLKVPSNIFIDQKLLLV